VSTIPVRYVQWRCAMFNGGLRRALRNRERQSINPANPAMYPPNKSSRSKGHLVFPLLVVMTLTPALRATGWASADIRLSNSGSSPTIQFQVLPNTQKLGVYDSLACEGCSNISSAMFSRNEFKQGQGDQLIQAIEVSTGIKILDGSDATERLNGLVNDQRFGRRLLELIKHDELRASLDFSAGEFKRPMAPEALLKAVQTGSQIAVPAAKTPIDSLNWLLGYTDLYKFMPRRPAAPEEVIKAHMANVQPRHPLSPSETRALNNSLVKANVIREFIGRLEQGQQLSSVETGVLNRFLLESIYPSETPQMPDALTIAKSIRELQFERHLSAEEMRALLETTYPQETPRTAFERYQSVEDQLPDSVRDGVYIANRHLFPRDGTHIHFAFSNDNKMYYGVPATPGFDLMELDATTQAKRKIAHLHVGDHKVPHLRISTISISPDNRKIALDLTSDPITLFGDSYHDMLVLKLGASRTTVFDLGNKAAYGGWWSSASDMFYTSCPLLEHSAPHNDEICAIHLDSD